MQRIFLLRAYGDFVIAVQAIAKADKKIHIVASNHLAPLYQALITAAAIPALSIEFIELGIQQGQLNFFTNKYFFSLATVKQLGLLKSYLKAHPNSNGTDFLEQEIRLAPLNTFLGHEFRAVVPVGAKVYQAYEDWLSDVSSKQSLTALVESAGKLGASNNPKTLVVFPDARLKKRVIQQPIIALLKKYTIANGYNFKVARMKYPLDASDLTYQNFDALIALIHTADFVVCTDSLPAHLANLLCKPHCILYPTSGMTHFFTPFALANNTLANFEQTNFSFLNNALVH